MPQPIASVVVPVYNRFDLARPVLDAFAAQRTTASFEAIVVDDGSMHHRHTYLPLIETGESIIRRSIAHVEAGADRLPGLDEEVIRILDTSISGAVFRWPIQRGCVRLHDGSRGNPDREQAGATLFPDASLVEITMAVLRAPGQPQAALELLGLSVRRAVAAYSDREIAQQCIRQAASGRLPLSSNPQRP